MARIEEIERRLLNWARWKHGANNGGLGYAGMRWGDVVNTSRCRESIIPTNDCEAEETDRAVLALEDRLRDTVQVTYLQDCSMRSRAAQLGCSEPAVKARVWQAHQCLSRWLADKAQQAQVERERVQRLQVPRRVDACAST
jgi:hypothetical protein